MTVLTNDCNVTTPFKPCTSTQYNYCVTQPHIGTHIHIHTLAHIPHMQTQHKHSHTYTHLPWPTTAVCQLHTATMVPALPMHSWSTSPQTIPVCPAPMSSTTPKTVWCLPPPNNCKLHLQPNKCLAFRGVCLVGISCHGDVCIRCDSTVISQDIIC